MTPVETRRSVVNAGQKSALLWLYLVLTVGLGQEMTAADSLPLPGVDAAAQARVAQLLQEALGSYRADTDPAQTETSGGMKHLITLEANLHEASSLMPERLDLRFGMASALILQAIHTNSQFDVCMSKAVAVYQKIGALDTNGFEAPLLCAAYTRANGDDIASEEMIRQLLVAHSERTSEYVDRFQRIERILAMTLSEEPRPDMPTSREHAIVVLGAALETNGTIKHKLVGRLRQALKLARLYPEAPLVLSGGNQKAGVTEAYAMSVWLRDEGVSTNRMHLEDRARDTVGNAVYSAAILEKLGVTHVTVVTSANHIRRGLVDLQEACLQRHLPLTYAILAAPGEPEIELCRERLAVYRDAMRASGLWAFPGIQR